MRKVIRRKLNWEDDPWNVEDEQPFDRDELGLDPEEDCDGDDEDEEVHSTRNDP